MISQALIVEDEPEANRLLSMLIGLRGVKAACALTGAEARDHLARSLPDVIFLDLMLPDVSGYTLCQELKRNRATAGIPLIVVTARVAAENRIRCYALGADDYISKPYMPEDIFKALDDALDRTAHAEDLLRQGHIEFLSGDDGETRREIARLVNLLHARTALETSSLSRALQELAHSADDFGRKHGVSRIATLEHRATPNGVSLSLKDHAGWLPEILSGSAPDGILSATASVFDEVRTSDDSRELDLVKRFV